MKIYLLCDVVDNYGDIGFVYRLARGMTLLAPENELVLVVNNLEAFSKLCGKDGSGNSFVEADRPVQFYNSWKILDWNNACECTEDYRQKEPEVILQCFQCARPEWLDNELFNQSKKSTNYIINVEYLTAEEWARDFHLLKSGTRSALVKKYNFMPGVMEGTGGLVLDSPFSVYQKESFSGSKKSALAAVSDYLEDKTIALLQDPLVMNVLVFTYEQDFVPMFRGFADYIERTGRKLHVLLARGAGFEPFRNQLADSGLEKNSRFVLSELPFIPQTVWDGLMFLPQVSLIRGEDSLSRACLCGVPFLWHAYRQDKEWQLVKVNAMLEVMKPFFDQESFETISSLWKNYNRNEPDAECERRQLVEFLMQASGLKKGYEAFSEQLTSLGDMAQHLLDFIRQLQF